MLTSSHLQTQDLQPCKVRGCGIPTDSLFCAAHWEIVPVQLRREFRECFELKDDAGIAGVLGAMCRRAETISQTVGEN